VTAAGSKVTGYFLDKGIADDVKAAAKNDEDVRANAAKLAQQEEVTMAIQEAKAIIDYISFGLDAASIGFEASTLGLAAVQAGAIAAAEIGAVAAAETGAVAAAEAGAVLGRAGVLVGEDLAQAGAVLGEAAGNAVIRGTVQTFGKVLGVAAIVINMYDIYHTWTTDSVLVTHIEKVISDLRDASKDLQEKRIVPLEKVTKGLPAWDVSVLFKQVEN